MAADEVRERALVGSAVKFMHKPFAEAELLDAIKSDGIGARFNIASASSTLLTSCMSRSMLGRARSGSSGIEQTRGESAVLSIQSKQGE